MVEDDGGNGAPTAPRPSIATWLGPKYPPDDPRRRLPANITLEGEDDDTDLPGDDHRESEGDDEADDSHDAD